MQGTSLFQPYAKVTRMHVVVYSLLVFNVNLGSTQRQPITACRITIHPLRLPANVI